MRNLLLASVTLHWSWVMPNRCSSFCQSRGLRKLGTGASRREGGREGGGGREGEEGREGGRKVGRERGREGGRQGEREGGRDGGREGGRVKSSKSK